MWTSIRAAIDASRYLIFMASATSAQSHTTFSRLLAPTTGATTPRLVSNASATEELVLLVIGGKGGYVQRDGHLVDPERDLSRRQAFGTF